MEFINARIRLQKPPRKNWVTGVRRRSRQFGVWGRKMVAQPIWLIWGSFHTLVQYYRNDERTRAAGNFCKRERAAQKTAKPAARGKLSVRCAPPVWLRKTRWQPNRQAPPVPGDTSFVSHTVECATGSRPHAYFNKVYLVYLVPIFLVKGGWNFPSTRSCFYLRLFTLMGKKYSRSPYFCCQPIWLVNLDVAGGILVNSIFADHCKEIKST
jgi:hypothetical protein